MKKLLILFFCCITFLNVNATIPISNEYNSNSQVKNTVIVTYVSNNEQERSVRALIKSIRELSGFYKECTVYVVMGDPENFPCKSLNRDNTILLPLEMDRSFYDYPLAIKAFAAAQVEEIVKNKARTLIWFDPGVMVLNSLESLDLHDNFDIAIRSVTLSNTISLAPDTEPNDHWEPIYKANKINYKSLNTIETIVGNIKIQPYYNCEVYSVNPKLGICKAWKNILTDLLKDENYQNNVCNLFRLRLFLHQAVLSGVIASNIKPERIKTLPISCGYPFNQHKKLSLEKQATSLNDLSVVIFDYAWERIPSWKDMIPANEALQQWLFDTYLDYLKITDNLYRIEGSCNSFLITTNEGSVLIDPAGASLVPDYFKKVLEANPLKAILLTHAHQDHWDHMDVWHTEGIPIIAQREFINYNNYRSQLNYFCEHRGAIWSRKPFTDTLEIKPFTQVVPTITFADNNIYELGGVHFNMTHTPGETPDHTTVWIPELDAVFVGDNYYEYFINNATLRGTLTRPILGYINTLNLALSNNPEYFFMGHGTPVISEKIIKESISNFRDALQYIYDETIKGINEGKDVYTLMQEIKVPDRFNIQPYFGKVEWAVRGIYHEYIGWFDENPVSMYSIPASSIYSDIVEIAGSEALLKKGEDLFENKEYVKVLHLTDVILQSNSMDKPANDLRIQTLKALKADTYNYIEKIWLDYGMRICEENLNK